MMIDPVVAGPDTGVAVVGVGLRGCRSVLGRGGFDGVVGLVGRRIADRRGEQQGGGGRSSAKGRRNGAAGEAAWLGIHGTLLFGRWVPALGWSSPRNITDP